ncbi:MAG TPA: CPBP family intramembrane glutamic endopeptidase [Candidatus Polarisedimenticolia bacterium]|nr:CPBP family intramembrane glutamic endopeptidase [Candidatus Polarisedimenticolia bacterium]
MQASRQDSSIHWRGHLFLFDRKRTPTYAASAGVRLLLIFVLLEGIIGPRLSLFGFLGLPLPPFWIRIPLLLAFALLAVCFVAKVKVSDLGLIRWREWNGTEKSYFVQLMILANVVFALVNADRLRTALAEPGGMQKVLTLLLPYLLWGFYQELMYRGILQTELVRRWGPLAGVLVANTLFTFGPLHFYHFTRTSAALPMFAGIFAIGLFFAVLFQRSGNLWIVAIAHGIGNFYIEGLGGS